MQTKERSDPGRSPVPGVIPDTPHVEQDHGAPPRRDPSHGPFHRFLAHLRGDAYMTDAYPPRWHTRMAAKPSAPEHDEDEH